MNANPEKDTVTVHYVEYSLIPEALKKRVFNAALFVAWRYDDGAFEAKVDPEMGDEDEIREAFLELSKAVNAATQPQYTIPVEIPTENEE